MLIKRIVPLCALFLFAAGVAEAQTAGVVTLQANQTSATGSLVPVLTWSTNPVAQSCTASGGWSGTKAASGNQTLPSINASTNYTLTCRWGTGSATVSWVPPTTNTDESALTDLAGYKVLYGTSSTAFTSYVRVTDITARSTTVSSLAPGTWYFSVRAYNTSQVESANSNVASKVVVGATAARTVSITINAPPTTPPPTTPPPVTGLHTISRDVYDVQQQSGAWVTRAIVGSIALGAPCTKAIYASGGHYAVATSLVTLNGVTPVSTQLVAKCDL
jgi:hypothetical protein